MNELMEAGFSQRKAAAQMAVEWEKETGKKWKPESIRRIFRYLMYGTDMSQKAAFTGDNEWYTPKIYIEAVREVFGGEIDLDPATSEFAQEYIKAKKYYTVKDDGLNLPWEGKIWLNPPYSKDLLPLFVEKLIQETIAERLKEIIVLTHNYTDTAWFHSVEAISDLICFTRGRVRFVDDEGNEAAPTQGSAFFYIGENQETFKEVFGEFGFIR